MRERVFNRLVACILKPTLTASCRHVLISAGPPHHHHHHHTHQHTHCSHHVIFVLQKDGELLEEGDDHQQQLFVLTVQDLHQHVNNVFVPHLQLCARVFSQVEQQTQSNYRFKHKRHNWVNLGKGKLLFLVSFNSLF